MNSCDHNNVDLRSIVVACWDIIDWSIKKVGWLDDWRRERFNQFRLVSRLNRLTIHFWFDWKRVWVTNRWNILSKIDLLVNRVRLSNQNP